MYRSTLIKNKLRKVTPAPMAPNVSDKNHKKQALEGLTFPKPTLTMKLVCENNPTKRSEEINEQSKVFLGACSVGVRKMAHRTSRLKAIAVNEDIAFAMMRKMEISKSYQEMFACKSINVHNCSATSAVGLVEGYTPVWLSDMMFKSVA